MFRYEGGTTNTPEAIRLMYEQQFIEIRGDRPTVPNIGVIITDGRSNVNPDDTIPNAVQAQALGTGTTRK